MNIGMILLILRIIGAMPEIIEMAKKIWEWIKQIRDRRAKREARQKLRRIIWDRRSIRNMSVDETITCRGELDDLAREVIDQLRKEGKYV